jgi:hypothetical protein
MGNTYLVTIPLVTGLALCALSAIVFIIRRRSMKRIAARGDTTPWVIRTASIGPFLGSGILGLVLIGLSLAFLVKLA